MSRNLNGEMDAFDRDLMGLDDSQPPSGQFVAHLRASLRQEARGQESRTTRQSRQLRLVRTPTLALPPAMSHRRAPGWWTSVGLVAVVLLLIVSVGTLTYAPGRSDQTAIPAPAGYAATPSPEQANLPDVPMPGANPQRTNVHPGPGLTTLPEIILRANFAGQSMVLADGMLIVVSSVRAHALNAMTLDEIWSVELQGGAYSAPTIADGRIFLTVSLNTEAGGGEADENQLVALSLADGRELWRIDGAGTFPVNPIVDGETAYSVGVAEGQYLLGAYQVSTGEHIWQIELGPFSGCCPSIGLALGDGNLAVNGLTSAAAFLPTGMGVFDSEDGREIWTITAGVNESVGRPMIVGDLVVVNAAEAVLDESYREPRVGSTTAYELASGEIAWTNSESSRSYWAPISGSNRIVYAGPWDDVSDNARLALLSPETGETQWVTPLPRLEGDVQTYIGPPQDTAPVIVNDIVYMVSSAPPRGTDDSVLASLLTAVDFETGSVRWMAQIDGGVAATPIVSGGRIYVLTHDYGMYVLGDSGDPVPTTTATVDLRTPVTCEATPSQSPLLGELPDEPSIPAVAEWKQTIRFSEIPRDPSNVDPAVAEQIIERFKEYRACSDIEPYNSVFGFFSTDFYVRLAALPESMYYSRDQPWAIWMTSMNEFLWLDADQIHQLPDGRIGALVNSPQMNFYVWWVFEDGHWKIDEYHRIQADPVDPNAATPTHEVNAEGTPLG